MKTIEIGDTIAECRELITNANKQMWCYGNEGMSKDTPVFQELLESKRANIEKLKRLKNEAD